MLLFIISISINGDGKEYYDDYNDGKDYNDDDDWLIFFVEGKIRAWLDEQRLAAGSPHPALHQNVILHFFLQQIFFQMYPS